MATVFNTTIPLSQLSSPFILLPPNVVHRILLATYIHLGTVSVLLWDIINNLRNDWELVSSSRVGLATLVYFTTRTSLLAYSMGRAVLLTHTVENCAQFQDALNSFLVVFVASTTFLFYIRVTTLYTMDRNIVSFFGLAWLCTVAMTGTFCITFTAEHIGPTEYCIERPAHGSRLFGPTMTVQLANDLLLYAAITYKAYQTYVGDAITKGTLDPLGRVPLYTSMRYIFWEPAQTYCLSVIAIKAFLACAAFSFRQPTNYTFMICHLVLVNIWSSRMYRSIQRINRKTQRQDVLPPMITQGEYELRLSTGSASARQQPAAFGAQTFTPDLDVRIPGQSDMVKGALCIREEKRSSIYSVETDIKT